MERIKTKTKEMFVEVFTEELVKGGYELANERAEDVLIVKPAIINLDVKAPDIVRTTRGGTLGRSAGEMTLYASRNSLPSDFERIIKLIEDERINTRPWITHRSTFNEIIGDFPSYAKPETGVIKAIIEVDGVDDP